MDRFAGVLVRAMMIRLCLWMASFGRWVWRTLSRTMKPATHSRREGRLDQLELVAVILVGFAHVYWADWEIQVDVGLVLGNVVSGQFVNAGWWLGAVLMSTTVLALLSCRSGFDLVRECRPTGEALATLVVCVGGLLLVAWLSSLVMAAGTSTHSSPSTGRDFVLMLLALSLMLSVFPLLYACGCAVVLGARYKFRAGESAPPLLPLSVLALSVIAVVGSFISVASDGFEPELPVWLGVLGAFLGPVISGAWAVYVLTAMHETRAFDAQVRSSQGSRGSAALS